MDRNSNAWKPGQRTHSILQIFQLGFGHYFIAFTENLIWMSEQIKFLSL